MRETGLALAQSFPDKMREKLEPLLDVWFREYEHDLTTRVLNVGQFGQNNPAHRTALDLYPRMMRLIGVSDEAVEKMLVALGLQQSQLALAARMYHDAAGATMLDARRNATAVIREIVRTNPDETGRLLEECFGLRAADATALLGNVSVEERDGDS